MNARVGEFPSRGILATTRLSEISIDLSLGRSKYRSRLQKSSGKDSVESNVTRWGWLPRVLSARKGSAVLAQVEAVAQLAYLACASCRRREPPCALVGVTSFRGLSCQTHVGRPRRGGEGQVYILPATREKEDEARDAKEGCREDDKEDSEREEEEAREIVSSRRVSQGENGVRPR